MLGGYMGVAVDEWLGGYFDSLIDGFNDIWGKG